MMLVCAGEAFIDFVAQSRVGDVGASELFRRAAGGAVANVAAGVARLGGQVCFVGTLGRDPFGRYLMRTLAHEGVNLDGVRLVDAATTLAFVARDEEGRPDFMFVRSPGADSLLSVDDLPRDTIRRARIFHFGGVLLSRGPARTACLEGAKAARAAGALVTFDPNVRPALWESPEDMRHWTLAGCAEANLVKLSDDDARLLGLDAQQAPRALLTDVTRAVVLTRGGQGAEFVTARGGHGSVAAPRVRVVDTTGAGDATMAALLWRLQRAERDPWETLLEDAVRFACAAGAFACQREGAIPSLPGVHDVERLLHDTSPMP
jgi:fructokinase